MHWTGQMPTSSNVLLACNLCSPGIYVGSERSKQGGAMIGARRRLRIYVLVLVSALAVLALEACTSEPQPPEATLPILLTDQVNPPGPHAGTGWAKGMCGGHTWLWDKVIRITPRYEWTPVLGDESETQIVAASGWAVNSGLSSQDMPFTHIYSCSGECA
jgi:hypothetical protein